MKINHKILSIPPYISTTWDNIKSVHIENDGLAIILKNDSKIKIPLLEEDLVKQIFQAHTKYLDEEKSIDNIQKPKEPSFSFGFPLKLTNGEGIESFAGAMHHNPSQANSPDLPEEVLNKIAAVAKALGLDDHENMPQAEPHCNCVHCQISRALHGDSKKEKEMEVEINDEDLKFRDWEIEQKTEHLYLVTNPLNKKEHYNVFLGNPLGCTCGERNCEHIRTVLNS